MTTLSMISELHLTLLSAALLSVSFAMLYLSVNAFILRLSTVDRLICIGLCAIACASLLLLAMFLQGPLRPTPVGWMPVVIPWGWTIVFAVIFFDLLLRMRAFRREHLSEFSIKEGLDQMPTGLLFADEDGKVYLKNSAMEWLCRQVTKEALLDARSFWEGVQRRAGRQNAAAGTEEVLTVTLPDESVWNLRRRRVREEKHRIYEVIATEVTEYYRINRELEERQRLLSRRNKKLRSFDRRLRDLAREEEMLAAKMKIHNDYGSLLLATKHLLQADSDVQERKELLFRWRKGLIFLHEEQEEKTDTYIDLIRAANAIGVQITVDGALPQEEEKKRLTEELLHTCLTNTVRHAGGSRVFLTVERKEDGYLLSCKNDGRPPEGPIREGGGLTSLRQRIEQAGGTMRTESSPEFLLSVYLP